MAGQGIHIDKQFRRDILHHNIIDELAMVYCCVKQFAMTSGV